MAKTKLWVRTSFWAKVTISFNLILTGLQAVLIANSAEHIWNYIALGGQLAGNLIALWTEDKNKNDIPDVLEEHEEVQVTSTTTTTIKKNEEPTSETETTIEIKPKQE